MKTDQELWFSLIGMFDLGTPHDAEPTSGFIRTVDGPWACYACCVFGTTAEGAEQHRERKHPLRIIPITWGQQDVGIYS